jgi:hypothetical protein
MQKLEVHSIEGPEGKVKGLPSWAKNSGNVIVISPDWSVLPGRRLSIDITLHDDDDKGEGESTKHVRKTTTLKQVKSNSKKPQPRQEPKDRRRTIDIDDDVDDEPETELPVSDNLHLPSPFPQPLEGSATATISAVDGDTPAPVEEDDECGWEVGVHTLFEIMLFFLIVISLGLLTALPRPHTDKSLLHPWLGRLFDTFMSQPVGTLSTRQQASTSTATSPATMAAMS